MVLVGLAAVAWLLAGGDSGTVSTRAIDSAAERAQEGAARQGDAAARSEAEPVRTRATDAAEAARPEEQRSRVDPARLFGRVVRASDGEGVAGATVELRFRDADDFWNLDMEYGERIETLATVTTDPAGRFAFDVARGRSHRLRVSAHGFAPRTVHDCMGGAEVVVELGRGASLEGIVTCAGDPVVDVPVRLNVVGESVELGRMRTD
ncbi:MAG: carboxypeptidase regulatory-like domain-containing protein, partial [Pseudomonadales bacterium]|nr:carboxypeptidase regulatory-like domain-containing protein [Pseudomonadales bacterium]